MSEFRNDLLSPVGDSHFFRIRTPPISLVMRTADSAWEDEPSEMWRLTCVGLKRYLDSGEDENHTRDDAVHLGCRQIISGSDRTDHKVTNDKNGRSKDDERSTSDSVDQQNADEGSHLFCQLC